MGSLKQIVTYAIWTVVAILLGIGYMRIVLGPNEITSEGLWYLVHIFFDFGLLYIGTTIGLIIAILFTLLNIFYLKKKLKNNIQATGIRFLFLLVITVLVGFIHYILEKVIDVI